MPRPGSLIPAAFYLRPVDVVARDLLGRHLCLGPVTLRITEVEAYGGPQDSASHARSGRTPRNAPMWEAGGCAYVYFCYGMHHMLNVVTGPPDRAEAVLIRSCEPVTGLDLVLERRRHVQGPALLTGPGKVAQALGVDLAFTGTRFHEPGGLELRAGSPAAAILAGPRVGVDFASPADRDRPWRFAEAGTPWVSRPRNLR
ncbi:DNA-3-methyladenine glycosylase [Mesoterricola silvestris]|uniref:Putative 3-methyladenine DNA glycosylase n=1 Tax=Mesoterricola silvestris TaxID=2927979 RepID=A0AA48H9S9_9BACT|nr:DNA-3-methyladenine glycosylase [Mesoterricola silvestris]BDU74388.1 putative 3-methyladenine DNA glycosylase [Mesoterricola silvestris]